MTAGGARRVLALLALAAVLVAATPVPSASASGPGLELSEDGRRWSATLRRPLLDPARLWVPGDRVDARFWARNQSTEPARLDLAVTGAGDDLLLGGLVTSTAVEGRAVPAGAATLLPPGRAVPVRVRVELPASTGNDQQLLAARLVLHVRLAATAGVGGEGAEQPPEPGGPDPAAPEPDAPADRGGPADPGGPGDRTDQGRPADRPDADPAPSRGAAGGLATTGGAPLAAVLLALLTVSLGGWAVRHRPDPGGHDHES
ncbi:hypothetical protein ACFFOM_17095 [Microlunatus capsulatus]|uniref:Uncharacterized protein n=1 Tax=Microlunatus capsulatus TaxID=99117 RepID=A0ABS4ZCT1_9ACTN|nr:hypothetical protein [Microlunatus capsulatus]MBP2418542.1 hypothetical protein [Microlunatus capsulatus]